MDSKITFFLLFFFSWGITHAQSNYDLALTAIEEEEYSKALSYLDNYQDLEQDQRATTLRGKVYYRLNDLDRTIRDLTRARKLGYDAPDLYWLMAQTMHHKGVYEEAIYFYKNLLGKVDPQSDLAVQARIEIKNCSFSIDNHQERKELLVQGFGEGVNSYANEMYVAQSPQYGNLFYYTSDVTGVLKMKASYLNDQGDWISHDDFSKALGNKDNRWMSDISSGGQSLIYFQKHKNKARAVVSTIVEDKSLELLLDPNIFKGARDIQILNANTLLFVSDQLGGYGGFDIFEIQFENNTWSPPVNLGPEVNSSYDERTPYMSSDRRVLYFSSNKPYCYGGFDIYKAEINTGTVTQVLHLNSTINSAGNDLGFRLHNDAQMAFLYSDRKTGKGAYDLYFAYLDEAVNFVWADSLKLAFVPQINDSTPVSENIFEELQEDTLVASTDVEMTNDTIGSDVIFEEELMVEKKPEITPEIISTVEPEEALSFPNSLFYQDKTDLLTGENADKLSRLIELLKEKEDLNVKLIVYTDKSERGLPEYIQYNNLKRGLTIGEYLEQNGVQSTRIAVESYAYNYPLSKNEIAGKLQPELAKFNRRVDIELFDWQGSVYWAPDTWSFPVPSYARAREYGIFSGIREEVYFSVKIASVERMFKNAVLRMYQDVYVRKESMDDLNSYYVGIYTDYDSAMTLAQKLNNQPRITAEIVPFYNGHKINKADINRLEINYPELSYIKE